jgi:addiction module HigA family antidote
MTKKLQPVHPGEVLTEEFLIPMGVTQYRLAKEINVPARRINEIVHAKRGISADTALRLACTISLNLQTAYDLDIVRDRNRAQIEEIVPRVS